MTRERTVTRLRDNWKFTRTRYPDALERSCDDSNWETVRVPHDWAIAGPFDKTDNVLTAKPVYPVELNENWNLINRGLIPFVSRGRRTPGGDREAGLGDITYQGFVSPAAESSVTWGLGPTFVARTGTADTLTSDKWSLGPSAVLLAKPGRWVVGTLISNVWSFAGDDDAKGVNLFSLQYFANYNFDGGWYLMTAPVVVSFTIRWVSPVIQAMRVSSEPPPPEGRRAKK